MPLKLLRRTLFVCLIPGIFKYSFCKFDLVLMEGSEFSCLLLSSRELQRRLTD
jgi:hypothetical protein